MLSKNATLLAAVLSAAALVACSSVGLGMSDSFGGATAGDGGNSDGAPDDPKGNAAGATPDATVSGIIAVHASRNLPAFRLCFPDQAGILPLPDDKLMPNANVVGVDVGGAVHLGAFGSTLTGSTAPVGIEGGAFDAGSSDAGASDAGATDASAAKDAGASSDVVYVIEEKIARQFYPQNSDAEAWPNCGPLVTALLSNGYEGHGIYTTRSADALGATLLTNGAMGVSLIVIEGCLPDTTPGSGLDVAACGAGFTPTTGNLRYRIVPSLPTISATNFPAGKFPVQAMLLSPRVKAEGNSTLSFGLLNGQKMALPALSYGQPVPAVPQPLDFAAADAGDYDSYGFSLQYGDAGLVQSLTTVQALSSPRELPQSFYLLPSNFVILVVGDPAVPALTTGPGGSLHLLAVPVRDPDTLVDAGRDAAQ
jgi:hypothetical protein